jgi:two-component system, LytTR family, sensor kinase
MPPPIESNPRHLTIRGALIPLIQKSLSSPALFCILQHGCPSHMTTTPSTQKAYWTSQIIGWSLFFFIYSLIAMFFTGVYWQIFASYLVVSVTGLGLSHGYRYFIKKYDWRKLPIQKLSLYVVGASILIGLVWAAIIIPVNSFIPDLEEDPQELTLGIILVIAFQFTVVMIGWSLMYFVVHYFESYRQSEVEKWKLEAAVKDAELIALKSQINPHFIFNCLNNIRSLVVENPEKARDMITHLSVLLRYSIQFNNLEKVDLRDEIAIVKDYLTLESIQFENRLSYAFDIAPETQCLRIPPMIIQLLVENAIKHGISQLPKGGQVQVRTYMRKENLHIEVINTGQLQVRASTSTGIGLKNASDRIKILFGKLSDLTVENLNEREVMARFTLPLSV